ncbi:hypothetical protein CDD81_101 [Ophiocordyceps australis]|uniref:DNA-directed RNA polymerase III subunit RPC6 n=1 Tax=Ophiocordyceps australis TaxID=1399860 RepID=A0A2C5YI00_9HYPO|nr:hypothetical protein CDD81_101 [Ophiocordyceps australis]
MPGATADDADAAKLQVWKQALYERCKGATSDNELLSQDDLLRLDVIPNRDLILLARVVQSLSDDKLFVTMREASGQVLWKWRDAQEAHKYKQCASDEQVMVYSLIDDSGGDGIWSQTLQKRLNMHDSVLKNALKQLQAKGLVAPFKNVEHPNKKMYIKASIRPSDRATGGPWYTDQNLDVAFIEELQRVVFDYIKSKSSYRSSHGAARIQTPAKGTIKGGAEKSRKRPAAEMSAASSGKPAKSIPATSSSSSSSSTLFPLPAGYVLYPSVRDIARLLSTSGITNNTVLSEQDVKKLVDVLVWDKLVEPVKVAGRLGYRVTRVARQSPHSWSDRDDAAQPEFQISPYTEAPCGRCPVFDLCEEGGPVSPSNCVYFKRWLGAD